MKRVVVTGTGVISPIGNTTETFWENLKKKTVGIGRIDRFDTEKYKTKLAAQVKDFDPLDTMEFKEAKRMELFGQLCGGSKCRGNCAVRACTGNGRPDTNRCLGRLRDRKYADYGKIV